jgi:hypothetical protein
MSEDAEQEQPFELPDFVRASIESVARFMRVGATGHGTLELQFQDGRLRRWYRHEGPAGAKDLEGFTEPA